MDMELVKPLLAGAARHALTTFGGSLATAGIIQANGVSEFVGAGMCLAGIGWSWWQKVGQAKVAALLKKLTAKHTVAAATQAAEVAPVGAAVAGK